MDIGNELLSMSLALKLQQRSTAPPIEAASLRLAEYESMNDSTFNSSDKIFDSINTTSIMHNDTDLFYRHPASLTIGYCIAYSFVFIVGLIGNSFVIAVVLRAPKMRTVTNYFIVNLALADILVIVFCLPATLMSNIFVPWMLGWVMCKVVPYIQGVSVAASIYSLIAVSLDRLIAIWWPLKFQITKKVAKSAIIGIWSLAGLFLLPWAMFFDLVPIKVFPGTPDVQLCVEIWPTGTNGNLYFLFANLIACYILPMILITLCYILIWIKVWKRSIPGESKDAQMDRMQQKSKIKVVKMLVAVVILFVLSWLPLYIIFARIKLGGPLSAREEEFIQTTTPLAQWLGSSNSCINPILYAFFNKKYRRGFAAIVRSKTCCGRLRNYDSITVASSTTSTRKSSHYHNNSKKSPYSPSIKSDAVSYIYEQNLNGGGNGKRHNGITKQNSDLSRQLLLKQDSNVSRQSLLKQDSAGSRQMLIKQDSVCSKHWMDAQDVQISYIDAKRGQLMRQDSDLAKRERLTKQDTQISYIESKKSLLSSQDSIVSFVEPITHHQHHHHQLIKQDSVVSFAECRPAAKRHVLVKQDSVISFADQRRGYLTKQDSVIAYPTSYRNGETHHVSILKKTNSQNSSSPHKSIEFVY